MNSNGERARTSAAGEHGRGHSLAAVAKDAAADLVDLVVAQIRLVRAELSAEARGALARITRILLFAPVLVVGYAFAMAALASVLARPWGWPLALAAVAGLQLVAGTWGVLWSLRRLARLRLLPRTTEEVAETVRRIEATGQAAERASERSGEKIHG